MRSRACWVGLTAALVLSGCGSAGAAPAAPQTPSPEQLYVVTRVIDGDTVEVTRGGVLSNVRLIGIDAPEAQTCEGIRAEEMLSRQILGKPVELTVSGRAGDLDLYGRWLRYVGYGADAHLDAGQVMLEQGLAVAKYDSRDGYGKHPREDEYIALDDETPNFVCTPGESGAASDTSVTPVYYPDCDAARRAGAAPLTDGEPGYRDGLDRDSDGTACDK